MVAFEKKKLESVCCIADDAHELNREDGIHMETYF